MHGHDSIKQLVDIVETGNKQGDSRSNISMGLVPGPGGQVSDVPDEKYFETR